MSIINTRLSAVVAALLISVATVAASQSAIAQADAAPAAASAPAAAPAPEAVPAASAAASIDAAAAPVTPGKEAEAAEDPYGPAHAWTDGGPIGKSVIVVLVLMSVGSWYIILTKFFDQMKMMGQAKEAKSKFWKASSVQAGISSLKDGSPFRYIAEAGVKASEHHEGALLERIDLSTWVTMAVQRAVSLVQSRLQNGLSFLATVGSTSPFVGLFGTVIGIMKALVNIGTSGQASIDKVAGPVGEALIMTAFGLFVAVPAVLGYNFLVRRNKMAMEEINSFGADVHMVLVSGTMNTSDAARAGAKKGSIVMSMSIGSPDGEEDAVMADINTTPLVDIMLVLLIIFLVTSPLVLKLKKVKLPAEVNKIYITKPENITLVVTKDGDMYWNQLPVPDTAALLEKLKVIAVMKPQPELHIRGDQETRYEFIGKVILAAQKASIAKVAFITEPPARN